MAELGQERFDAAFKQVLLTSSFRPDISEIRKAAGVNHGIVDPVEQQAMKELRFLIAAMRVHTPRLVTIFAEKGNMESPKVPPPRLSDKSEAALLEIGMGSREAGLCAIAGHPAISKDVDERFRNRNAAEIERKWCESWR
jgi:hypothetical protein